jgi:hypothetical protein
MFKNYYESNICLKKHTQKRKTTKPSNNMENYRVKNPIPLPRGNCS